MSAAPQFSDFLKFSIEVIKGPHIGQKLSFDKKSVFIGRGNENEIVLSLDPRISRQHAEIKQMDGQFYVINLSQKNFILLNGEKAETEKIKSGDLIQVGESEIKFVMDTNLSVPPAGKNQFLGEATVAVPPTGNISPLVKNNPLQAKATAVPGVSSSTTPPNMASPTTTRQQGLHTPQATPAFQQPPPPSATSARRGPPVHNQDSGRIRFYVIIVVVGILAYFFLSDSDKSKKKENEIRSSVKIEEDLQEATKSLNNIKEKNKKLEDKTYLRAQENYLKGFREYRQGNYLRARDFFQIVLSLDPGNDLAKTYLRLSRIKYDEMIQYNMMQGLRYRERKNYRMCKSSFSNVLTMIQNNKSHPSYKQADLFFEECSQALQERY